MCKVVNLNLTNTKNVEEVTIGESTKRLLRCKAMLSDIFTEVNDICDGKDAMNVRDDMVNAFNSSFSDLNASLVEIMADAMDYVSVEKSYKVM